MNLHVWHAFVAPLALALALASPADDARMVRGRLAQAGGVYEAVVPGARAADPAAKLAVASALFVSVKADDADRVKALLDLDPALVGARDENGRTLLHWAASGKSVLLLELLIDRGANVNAADSGGWTPLHVAAKHGSATLVEALLNRGARLYARTAAGQTVFGLAARNGDARMKSLLGARGRSIQ